MGKSIPSKQQLYNKIAATKKNILPSKSVRNTHELRENIADYLAVPESEIEAFVPYNEIIDELNQTTYNRQSWFIFPETIRK